MYKNGTQSTMTVKPSPQVASSTGFEKEILLELEQKRRQIEDEIAAFRTQKEKEFRDFERELRESKKRRSNNMSVSSGKMSGQHTGIEKPPSRTSSSSALNLLVGRGASKQAPLNNVSLKRSQDEPTRSKPTPKTAPSVSQPVVSLDTLNIRGETAISNSGRPRTPPIAPKSVNKLPGSPSNSSLATVLLDQKQEPATEPSKPTSVEQSPESDQRRDSLAGLVTPSYISLIDSDGTPSYQSSSVLETPPADEEDRAATAPSSYKSGGMVEVLPLSSSSFPPHVTISPGGQSHSTKRAYTAPTVSNNRKPSALRVKSSEALARKPKHVTFRLADSAIVEPSSSYEEGSSPLTDSESKPGSGSRSPLRNSKGSQLHRTLSPDEEDAEAGVEPGMGMGDVIQRLNEYSVTAAAENGESLDVDVEDGDEDDDDDEDDEDVPMRMSIRHDTDLEDDSDRHLTIDYHEDEDEDETQNDADEDEEGYFSPKAKHISTMTSVPRGNSPLAPYMEGDWAELSSSDKDRLLFGARRNSDDSDDTRNRGTSQGASPTHLGASFVAGLRQNVDGGSGVGFFELDEELASPDAGQPRPFEFDNDFDDLESPEKDGKKKVSGLGLSTSDHDLEPTDAEKKRWSADSAKFGVGSVPIDIIRPSLSVSSSWVGTFGH